MTKKCTQARAESVINPGAGGQLPRSTSDNTAAAAIFFEMDAM